MDDRTRRLACIATAVALVGGLSACSKSSPGPAKTVVVTVTPTQTATASTQASETSPSAPTSTAAKHRAKLPGNCYSLLPISVVASALGHSPGGKTSFVVGKAEKDIGRLAYINCRYGVPSGSGAAKLEIGVSLYNTDKQASQRIPATATDYLNHGANQSSVTIDGQQATILTGGTGAGYTAPTLVVADGQRTVAVTLNDPKVTAKDAPKTLTKIATVAVKQTAAP